MDRDDCFFPDNYITATVARAAAVSRGVGFREVYECAKQNDFKPTFQGMRRPQALDLRWEHGGSYDKVCFSLTCACPQIERDAHA